MERSLSSHPTVILFGVTEGASVFIERTGYGQTLSNSDIPRFEVANLEPDDSSSGGLPYHRRVPF